MDVNTAMLLYLRDRYSAPTGDLSTLLTRYLNTEVTADSATARFLLLIAEAMAANGEATVHPATVLLTNAQIKALPTTPVQIVAAPGANKVNIPLLTAVQIDGPVGYTNIAADFSELWLSWNQGFARASVMIKDNAAAGIANFTLFFNNISTPWPINQMLWPSLRIFDPAAELFAQPDDAIAAAINVNASLDLFCQAPNGDLTGGDPANTLRVSVLYATWNLTTGLFE